MAIADWDTRYQAWFNWFNSGGGPYFNGAGGDASLAYNIKNFNYAAQAAYNKNPGTMLTLGEGQSYGMLYALMGDNVKAFAQCYNVLAAKHKLNAPNIAASKPALVNGQPGWPSELIDFTDSNGASIFDAKGMHPTLTTFGWIHSEDWSNTADVHPGISSLYMAPDGEMVAIACLLMAAERWNVPGWRDDALSILSDFVEYGIRKCGGRYALTMGQYRGSGGFTLPYAFSVNFNSGTVYPDSNNIIADLTDFTTGDALRWYRTSGTMPGGVLAQDTTGDAWPKYYLGKNDSFNMSLYPTKADAIAGTNPVDITSVGDANAILCPFETQAGQIGTNPSYLFAPFFRLFAQYDIAHATIWNALASDSYGDIIHASGLNALNMPPYLDGINIADGSRAFFRAGGDSAGFSPDSFRVMLNMAFDKTDAALDVMKTQCQFNGTTQKWEPKQGFAGGVWRFYEDTGFTPFTFGSQPRLYSFATTDVDIAADTISLGRDWIAGNGGYTNPVRFVGAALPGGITSTTALYPRQLYGYLYSLHTSRAGSLANTGKVNITTVGTAPMQFYVGTPVTCDITTDIFTLSDESQAFRTGEALRHVPGGGTAANGLVAANITYGRMLSKNTYTVHTTEANAHANTGKINVTSLGTGEIIMTKDSPDVGWYYRGAVGGTTEVSPFGLSQILAYKFALNGLADAEAFYATMPSWVKQQGDGSFVESNGDYYTQHSMGWISGIMADRARARLYGRGYIIFNNASDANALQSTLASTLGTTIYATILTNGAGSQFAVPVIGVKAFDALSGGQQAALVKQLPTGQWRANL